MSAVVRPINVFDAAQRLHVTPSTIRVWGTRYKARKVGIVDRKLYFDMLDLAVIRWLIVNEIPVPPTPEERDRIRAELTISRVSLNTS
ncbi:hypothetical protein [Acrocarpospora sp. B8E8]|uniref:hypothetical protein n=1 Tax=Acrocarpospora sp. B8E8 TaxID=3153572 RepID=UPI00325D24AD